MKAIKYLLAAVLMIGFKATTMAQDVKSQVDAISKTIAANKNNPDAIKDQVKDFVKTNKKMQKHLLARKNLIWCEGYCQRKEICRYGWLKDWQEKTVQVISCKATSKLSKIMVVQKLLVWECNIFRSKNPEGYRKYATINSKTSPSGCS